MHFSGLDSTFLGLHSNYLLLFTLDSNHFPCYRAGLKLLAALCAGYYLFVAFSSWDSNYLHLFGTGYSLLAALCAGF